jgi:hypothetical protein
VTLSVAWESNWGTDLTLPTDFDMTGDQFKFVTLGSDGYVNIAVAGELAIGVVQSSPIGTSGVPVAVPVRTMAPTKIQAGGSFNPGDYLASDASGKAVLYTGAKVFTGTPYIVSGSQVLGIALSYGNSGQDTTMLFRPTGLKA